MSIRSSNLDLDLPTDVPDLPPPWPPTDVAIEWWMSVQRELTPSPTLNERLAYSYRQHFDVPFVLFDDEAESGARVAES